MNPFNRGDIVATIPSMATQRNGLRVEYTACYNATGKGGKTCSYKTCGHHATNDYCWVRDPITGALLSYIYGELMLDPAFNNQSIPPPAATATSAQPALGVPVDNLAVDTKKTTDAVVADFKKGIQDLHINRDKAMAIPNDKIDWEKYNGHTGPKNGARTYRKP